MTRLTHSRFTHSHLTHSLLGLLLGSASLLAAAQPAQGTPPAANPTAPHRRMAERMERMQAGQSKRLQELKAKLQLTPEQESAWSSYTAALQTRPAHWAEHEQQHQELSRLSTPERIDRMKNLRAQHQSEMNALMDRRGEATKNFYAAINPEQKKVFDRETARMMPGRHGHGPAGHHDSHHRHEGGRG